MRKYVVLYKFVLFKQRKNVTFLMVSSKRVVEKYSFHVRLGDNVKFLYESKKSLYVADFSRANFQTIYNV